MRSTLHVNETRPSYGERSAAADLTVIWDTAARQDDVIAAINAAAEGAIRQVKAGRAVVG